MRNLTKSNWMTKNWKKNDDLIKLFMMNAISIICLLWKTVIKYIANNWINIHLILCEWWKCEWKKMRVKSYTNEFLILMQNLIDCSKNQWSNCFSSLFLSVLLILQTKLKISNLSQKIILFIDIMNFNSLFRTIRFCCFNSLFETARFWFVVRNSMSFDLLFQTKCVR